MIAIYVILGILLFLFAFLIIPVRVKIRYREQEKRDLKIVNNINIYIFYFIKIKTLKLENKEKIEKKNNSYKVDAIFKVINTYLDYLKKEKAIIKADDITKIIKSIYYEKMDIDVGINLSDPIANAYAITMLNILINILIMKNQDRMNIKNIKYNTYISNNIFNLRLKCIIRFSLANTIITIIKIIIRLSEVKRKHGKESSNRFIDGNSYDVN